MNNVNHSSAFAIGDTAELSLDNFGTQFPIGIVDGILYYGDQIRYRVSLMVNVGTDAEPEAFLHEGRPVDGFCEPDLLPFTGAFQGYHPGERRPEFNTNLPRARFQIGDIVQVALHVATLGSADECPAPVQSDFHNIPVVVNSVRYEEGKVLYDVFIDRNRHFKGRLVADYLSGLDGICLRPVGGWPEPVTTGRTSGKESNKSNDPKSDNDDGVGYMC